MDSNILAVCDPVSTALDEEINSLAQDRFGENIVDLECAVEQAAIDQEILTDNIASIFTRKKRA